MGRPKARLAGKPGPAVAKLDRPAKSGQHAFAVIAGRVDFTHLGTALRIKTCQQDCRFDLGTGHWRGKGNPVQGTPAMDAQWRQPALIRVDVRTHRREWIDDASHWPARQGSIATQFGIKRLSGKQAGQQAHAGAGVATVDRCRCGTQAMQADAMHDASRRRRRLDVHAHAGECRSGRPRVLAFQETVDARDAVCQCGKHDRAM